MLAWRLSAFPYPPDKANARRHHHYGKRVGCDELTDGGSRYRLQRPGLDEACEAGPEDPDEREEEVEADHLAVQGQRLSPQSESVWCE